MNELQLLGRTESIPKSGASQLTYWREFCDDVDIDIVNLDGFYPVLKHNI